MRVKRVDNDIWIPGPGFGVGRARLGDNRVGFDGTSAPVVAGEDYLSRACGVGEPDLVAYHEPKRMMGNIEGLERVEGSRIIDGGGKVRIDKQHPQEVIVGVVAEIA